MSSSLPALALHGLDVTAQHTPQAGVTKAEFPKVVGEASPSWEMSLILAAAQGTALDLPGFHLHTLGSMALCWLHLASRHASDSPCSHMCP